VGPNGEVHGVDMTEEQISTAIKYIDYHTEAFGFSKSNVQFHHGYIEDLLGIGFKSNSIDLIISNCVVNLSPNKEAVLKTAYQILKQGGEFYFSDVYSDRRISDELREDTVLYGECLSGALYWNDFVNLAKKVGFLDPRLVKSRPLEVNNTKLKEQLGSVQFYSATYRLFKLQDLDPDCEDYGQAVRYKGNLENHPWSFSLDDHHEFSTGRIQTVCRNTFLMLERSRFNHFFEFFGADSKVHYGIFDGCGKRLPFATAAAGLNHNSSCC